MRRDELACYSVNLIIVDKAEPLSGRLNLLEVPCLLHRVVRGMS